MRPQINAEYIEGEVGRDGSYHSVPEAFNIERPIVISSPSFPSAPPAICGNVTKRSDRLEAGKQVSKYACICRCPSVVRHNPEKRAYLACAKRQCKFFRWADSVLDPPFFNMAHNALEWKPLSQPVHKLLPGDVSGLGEYIVQGSLGDCWFLSSVGVICENRDRLERVVDRTCLDESLVRFRFCYNGLWSRVDVDRHIPFFKTGKKAGQVAFASARNNVAFGPFVEKAYAKMYGAYVHLNGGQVYEALFDLTGCPTEVICLANERLDLDTLWAKLRSWKDCGFLIGCATSRKIPADEETGEDHGLVTCHAYSVTEVVELRDVAVGKQTKITDFVASKNKAVESERIECLRLVQVRNPWGRKEWTGDWSGKSEKWTRAVVEQLPNFSERSQKGKFWMELNDFLKCFHEIDVAKTHSDWFSLALQLSRSSVCLLTEHMTIAGGQECEILSNGDTANWCYITLVHPSIRGREGWRYYPDVHLLLYENGRVVEKLIGGTERVMTMECMLKPGTKYALVLVTFCPELVAHRDWKPVIRFFSALPLSVTIHQLPPGRRISVHDFVTSLPLLWTNTVLPSITVSVYSSYCTAVFVLSVSDTATTEAEIIVSITSKHQNLRLNGPWRHSIIPGEPSSSILGVISQTKCKYPTEQPLTSYDYQVELHHLNADTKRPRLETSPPDIIELD